jgi:hypothetical protein
MKVWLRNPKTGALKHVPVWRYAHYRKIAIGIAMGCGMSVLLHIAHHLVPPIGARTPIGGIIGGVAVLVIFAFRNRGSALMARGWEFAEPDSVGARMAATEWQMLPFEAPPALPSAPETFRLDEGAFLAATAGISTAPSHAAPYAPQRAVPVPPSSGASIFMRILMYIVAALAFLVGILCAAATRSDIQLGMSLTAFIGSFILLGLGHIMGRLAR